MAQGHVHLDTETFSCPICLDLLKDPVSTACGHSFCLSCITDCWDRGVGKAVHSCPQCREEFIPRPRLRKNTALAAVVEQLKETGVQAGPADHCCDAGAEDVACDVTEDRRRLLQHDSSAPVQAASSGSSGLRILPVSESGQKIQRLLRDIGTNTSPCEAELWPASREEFLRYSADLTLDPNTANTRIFLSEGNTRATYTWESQPYPYHPDRSKDYDFQVLSRESLTGRYYWEVKLREGAVRVAVAYKNISRAGEDSLFGNNDKSWALWCDNQSYGFWFNRVSSEVWGPRSNTVGVYLDHAAGRLSFYSVVSHSVMTLLRTVRTSFTQPLHAGLLLYRIGTSCELVKLG